MGLTSTPEGKKKYMKYWCAENRLRILASNKAWRDAHKPQVAARKKFRAYGLLPQDIDRMVQTQGGVCPGCQIPCPTYVDHDHACCPGKKSCRKCVRGILCMKCNILLGMAKDSPVILRNLALYLERWADKAPYKETSNG